MSKSEKMFEKASRLKLTYTEAGNGTIYFMDLWDLPLFSKNGGPSLDSLALALDKKMKENTGGSFFAKTAKTNEVLELKLELVKYIYAVLAAEIEAKEQEKALASEVAVLEKAIAEKKDEKIKTAPLEELEERLATLKAAQG